MMRVQLWGFDVSEAELRAGKVFERRSTDNNQVITLSWLDAHDCPLVSTYRVDLMARVTG